MAGSAAVLVRAGVTSDRHSAGWRSTVSAWRRSWQRLERLWNRGIEHPLAKWLYHDSARYRTLIARVAAAIDVRVAQLPIRLIRRLDPRGLGVYRLSRSARGPELLQRCRRLIAMPRGVPRSVARLLERELAGEPAWCFVEPGGMDALAADTLIVASAVLVVATNDLGVDRSPPNWTAAQSHLSGAANTVQTALRAYQRVSCALPRDGAGAVNLAYQAVNVCRRALNRTALLADEERLGGEAARLALEAAHAACSAAIELASPATAEPDAADPRDKLRSMARTVDALAARASETLRGEHGQSAEALVQPAARVLSIATAAVRPWGVNFTAPDSTRLEDTSGLCQQGCVLAEAAADLLDAWSVLDPAHQPSAGARSRNLQPEPPAAARWATRLVHALAGNWSAADVIQALRELAGPPDLALPAAAALAVLRRGAPQLHSALWDLIRASDSSPAVRSLALQLFLRTLPAASLRERHIPVVWRGPSWADSQSRHKGGSYESQKTAAPPDCSDGAAGCSSSRVSSGLEVTQGSSGCP
jgi:hypothetical protein